MSALELTLPPADLAGVDLDLPFPLRARISLAAAGDLKNDEQAQRDYFARAGASGALICRVEQVHSRTVIAVPPEPSETWPISARHGAARFVGKADGLVTSADGPWLAVTVADCLPLFLYDAKTGAYGLLHSGWKGTGILKEAVSLMKDRYRTSPDDLHVLAGPGIHACCYEVSSERGEVFSEWGPDAVYWPGPAAEPGRGSGHRPHLDLYAANRDLAEALGIATFTQVTHCTCCDPRFGSYRRQGPEHYTSMLALLGPKRMK